MTKRTKLDEIYTYAAIRSQIKDGTYKAIMLKNQLAELIGVNERTIYNYIDALKDARLILGVTKKHGTGEYAHNVYQFDYLANGYFVITPDFINDNIISARLKGLLLLMKTYCVKGTNYMPFKSQADLSNILHVGKNQISKYLKELEDKELIEIYDGALFLPDEYFPLYWANDDFNRELNGKCYKAIYDYCKSQKVVPPVKDADTNDIGMIAAFYIDPRKDILQDLKERCPKLPKDVSMCYFTKVLTNKKAI